MSEASQGAQDAPSSGSATSRPPPRFHTLVTGITWGCSLAGLLACSDSVSPSDPDGDPDPEFVNADVWAAGMESSTLGIEARAAGWEFEAQRETGAPLTYP